MKRLVRYIRSSLSRRLSFWMVMLVAAIFTTTLTLWFSETREVVREEAWNKATKTIEGAVLHIDNTLHRAEVAANNMLVVIESHLDQPDLMFDLSRQVLESNPDLTGCSISFEPYYFKEKGRYFSAYSYNSGDSILTEQEGTDNYQYFCMDWYLIPKLLDKPFWIEPFFEDAEEGIIVKDVFTSYSQPIHDKQGKIVGTFSVDICLDWFSSTISEAKPYPHSYSVMLGKGGTYLVHPDTTKLFYETIFTQTMEQEDSVITSIGEAMIAGETGHRIMSIGGEPSYVFYKPFKNTGWSVAIICPERDIFDSYNKLRSTTRNIMIAGLMVLLVFCLVIVDRNLLPLKRLAGFTLLTADGQFSDEVPDSSRPDEIGELQRRFRRMQQVLRQYMDQLYQETAILELQNQELATAYEHVKEEERVKNLVLHQMSEEIERPVQGILTEARIVCDCHHDLTEEDFKHTVNDMLQNTNQVTTLLDKLMSEAQVNHGNQPTESE
ncbi:MAG: Cache 3/Cache 2 fusion domain-containing protein [Prevotella sp.]|nr:Cache 3/Cache 2 fusion domain-containing protein [Prevotella sp.]